MVDIPDFGTIFAEQLESMIVERRLQLIPLETGDMRLAYRSGVAGSEWVDNTEAQAQRLRTEIADMQAIAEQLEKKAFSEETYSGNSELPSDALARGTLAWPKVQLQYAALGR